MRGRSKLPLLLMELALMVLVFSICAAICLSVFAASRKTAWESADLGRAAAWAQSAAEAYRAAKGDAGKAAELLGAEAGAEGFTCRVDTSWDPATGEDAGYTLTLTETGENAAHIAVSGSGGAIFSLDVKAVVYG